MPNSSCKSMYNFRLRRSSNLQDPFFISQVTGSRSKVATGSDNDVAQLDHGKNTSVKLEAVPLCYRDVVQTKFHVHFQNNFYVLGHKVKVKGHTWV